MLKRISPFIYIGFIIGCIIGSCAFAQYAVRADQVGELEIVTEYPGSVTSFFGDQPDVYIHNVGRTYSYFAYCGQELALPPGDKIYLRDVKPGDEVSIDIVMPIFFGAHITGVKTKAPIRVEAPAISGEPSGGGSKETALAAVE